MRRLIGLLLILGLLPLSIIVAQEEPIATEEMAVEEPITDVEEPIAEVTEEPAVVISPEIPVLVSASSDMELLATDQMGGERPVGWTGSLDTENPQFPLLTRLDLELLTGALLGAEERPAGWFGAVASTPFAIARDIRHDLELLADSVVGFGIRPAGWIGDDPLMRCSRATQNLVGLLERGGVFVLQLDLNDPNYCHAVEIQASQFTEVNLLSDPNRSGDELFTAVTATGPASINNDFAVAFLDRAALYRVGVIPNGTGFTPVARSYAQYSNMMLISGENFEVFVDYQFTTVTPAEFETLPDVSAMDINPVCGADWCIAG